MDDPGPAIQAVYEGQESETDNQQDEGGLIRTNVVGSLHAVVDIDGDRPGDSGNIAADHQHDPEFTHRMGE